ncbi:mannosyltransferase putative-domain-containing protein [Scheffersomyces coipomensis]|uniref:mannosyltransferase putative-domain-containing protein n=1 Tax=Scheffersomyces coipomensis TaxID=1788519 RepID=UPI00315C8E76
MIINSKRRVLFICLLVLALIILITGSRSGHVLYSSSNSKFSRYDSSGQSYSVKGYHHDTRNNFLVAQKQYDSALLDETDDASHYWKFNNADLSQSIKYNIKLINGYDYKVLISEMTEDFETFLNTTYMEKTEYESRFIFLFKKFFTDLFADLKDSKPSVSPINNDAHYADSRTENKYPNKDGRAPVYGGHLREQYLEDPIRTKDYLGNFLRLSKEEITSLTGSHNKFMEKMANDWPHDLVNKYNKFNDFMKGDGYVFLSGGKYDQLTLTAIKTLRSNGSKLPVEVIIPYESDYDFEFCNNLLPILGGRCKIMTQYIPHDIVNEIKGFQLKNVALLISSFENILYLDSDSIPIKNPDVLFINKPFINNHMVVWPDLWRRSTSPLFYEIADIKVNYEKRVRNSYFPGDKRGTLAGKDQYSMHDCEGAMPDPSSETGQFLINKRVHFKTLVLSMYYNYFGPDYFYPLFSQGAAGEGDKETFLAAAHKLGLPYYQVREFNREFGTLTSIRRHEVFAMGQYDPIVDYIQSKEDEKEGDLRTFDPKARDLYKNIDVNDKTTVHDDDIDYYNDEKPTYANNDQDGDKNNYNFHLFKSSNLFILHANWPKLDLVDLFLRNANGRGCKNGNGTRRRLYGKDLPRELQGYDFELTLFKNMKWIYCEVPNLQVRNVPEWDSDDRKEICKQIKEQVEFLESSSV